MKKSLTTATLATTWWVKGSDAIEAPAISAPISAETDIGTCSPASARMSPRCEPNAPIAKHHPTATTSISSGVLAIQRNATGSACLASSTATAVTMPMPRKVKPTTPSSGLAKLGCSASTTIGPDVLGDQHADRDAADHRVHLELLLHQLDDQQRRRRREREADVDRHVRSGENGPAGELQQCRRAVAEGDAERELQQPGQYDRLAAAEELAEVDLQADDEQQQRQAEVRDSLDVGLVGDDVAELRADDDAGDQERGDRRDLQPREHEREEAGDDQAEADVGDQRLGAAGGGAGDRRCERGQGCRERAHRAPPR